MNTRKLDIPELSPDSPFMSVFQNYCCTFYIIEHLANGIIAYVERKATEAYGQNVSFDLTFRGLYLRIIRNTDDSLGGDGIDEDLLRKIYLELFNLPNEKDIWVDLTFACSEDEDETFYTLECSPAAAAIISKNALSMADEAI